MSGGARTKDKSMSHQASTAGRPTKIIMGGGPDLPLTNEEIILLAQSLGNDVKGVVGVSLIISPMKGTATRVHWYNGELEEYSQAHIKRKLCILQSKIKGTSKKNFNGAALCLFGLTQSDITAMKADDTEFRNALCEAFQYVNYWEPAELSTEPQNQVGGSNEWRR